LKTLILAVCVHVTTYNVNKVYLIFNQQSVDIVLGTVPILLYL